jgi:hypothetical protein
MLVDTLKGQWICSCGNWVDQSFEWCPDCCEDRFTHMYDGERHEQRSQELTA